MDQACVIFWRKLDSPGSDVCRLARSPGGWHLAGTAVFWDAGACCLSYDVSVDAAWRTRRARISGFVDGKAVDVRIASAANRNWRVNGAVQESVAGCVDVDLGFTPATNLVALRRLQLQVGHGADAPAVYLQMPQLHVVRLAQTYRRIGAGEYQYEAPAFGYSATLRVLPSGVIVQYPGLFECVSTTGAGASP